MIVCEFIRQFNDVSVPLPLIDMIFDQHGIEGCSTSPVAFFTHTPDTPTVGGQVLFNAVGSFDPDGSIVSYQWNFGDGNSIEGPGEVAVNHFYDQPGQYEVTLTVTDNDGLTHSLAKTIMVGESPVAFFTHTPDTPMVGGQVLFNAAGSFDPDGPIVNYQWNFGDGNSTEGPGEVAVNHFYDQPGQYEVTLTVTDNDGLTHSLAKTIMVGEPPVSSFIFSPENPLVGDEITFDASASSDPDGDIVLYEWDFGDGTTAEGLIVSHTYTEPGAKTVTLTVHDNHGLNASFSQLLLDQESIPKILISTELPEPLRDFSPITMRLPYRLKINIEYEDPVANQVSLNIMIEESADPKTLNAGDIVHSIPDQQLTISTEEPHEIIITPDGGNYFRHEWDWAYKEIVSCSKLYELILGGVIEFGNIFNLIGDLGHAINLALLNSKY